VKLALLVFPGFSEFELSVAASIVARHGTVEALGLDADPVVSEAGLRVVPDRLLAGVGPGEYDALLIPGGTDLSAVMDHSDVHRLLQAMDRREKLLGAICAGPIVLAKAGVLANRAFTTSLYREHRDAVGGFDEANFRSDLVVEDGHILTAHGSAFVEFGLRVAERLGAMTDAEAVRAYYRGLGDLRTPTS
jgi:4-methyl-5(b-hydroxyethyl)-thiazole monophosphate biosynthesis